MRSTVELGESIAELVARRAAERPDAVAIEDDERRLGYAELIEAADRVAAALRAAGVEEEEPVAVCLPRSWRAICAALGALRASAAYVPLGVDQPTERCRRMLERAGASRVLAAPELPHPLPDGVERLDFDSLADHDNQPGPAAAPAGGDRLAYVLFTSGSTGEPKGVEITHANLAHVLSHRTALNPELEDAVLGVAPPEFDIAAWETWGALTAGARLVLAPAGRPDPRAVARLIAKRGVTYAFFAAGFFEQVVRAGLPDLSRMRLIAAGGDVMSPAAAAALRAAHPQVRLLNAYGPTETSIVASFHEVDEVGDSPLPIGRALPGYELHVLDEHGEPAPAGERGELWIGGPGVGRGYCGDPTRTEERFLSDRFSGHPGARIYATGDVVWVGADGELRFAGRADDQVKIAGHRIEPGEVEQALGTHPAVVQSAVVAREDVAGHKRLVAYAAAREGVTVSPAELLDHLAGRLPRYMLPTDLEVLPELPLTPRGKIGRRSLPAPRRAAGAAATGTAGTLAELMGELMGLDDVGRDEDFFVLGGDSLLAIQLIGRVRDRFGADLGIDAVFEARTPGELATLVDGASRDSSRPPLRPSAGDGPAPASFAQRRAWLFERTNPESLAYQFACVVHLDGALDEGALHGALDDLLRRHEILRTALVERDGEPVQVVAAETPLPLETIDLRGASELSWVRLIRERVRTRIELNRAPLVRWTLVRRADRRWSLIDVEHHAVHDGWSFMVLLDELAELYSARAEEREPRLPDPVLQFGDFARWERAALDGGRERRQLDYWRRALDPDPPLLDLPGARPRPRRESFAGGSIRQRLDPALATRVRELAVDEGATSFMACLAAFALLLGRCCGEERLQIGSGLAGRLDPAADRLLGMTVATVALPIDLGGDPSVRELLRRVRNTVLDGVANSEVPFDRVVEAVRPPRRADRSPLVQTLFSFDDAPVGEQSWSGLRTRVVQTLPNGAAKADLNVIGVDHGDDGEPFFIWEHSDLLDDGAADRLAGQHLRLLEQFVERPEAHLSELDLLGEEERSRLAAWSSNAAIFDREATIPGLVAARSRRDPKATAIRGRGGGVSYAELTARAAAVSAALSERGVGRGDPVGVLLGRSPGAIVAQLGVLRAGGAYVPLDPQHPPERIRRILADADVATVLTDGELRRRLPVGVAALEIADAEAGEAGDPAPVDPDDLAYLIYTSGSTGEPKGVEVTHRNVARLVDEPDYAELGPGTTMLHAASPAFDAATLEVWGALANGGAVACLEEQPSPDAVAAAIEGHGVTTLWLTAGLFHELVDRRPKCLGRVRQLLAGGDVLSPDHVRRALEALPMNGRLTNGYGPTETTTFAATHDLRPGDRVDGPIPIGRPIQGTSCVVLDAAGHEAPIGLAGELAIGGDGVARGYRGDPELTAQRFRPDPDRQHGRRYLTGDRVRRRPDGTLEFLGRIDRQVKVRGVRVEPAEVEEALRSHPAVADAAVVPFERAPGDLALAAYLVGGGDGSAPDPQALRAHAGARLPAAMVPTAWVPLPALPLTANGKLDRERLPAPGREHLAARRDGARPSGEAERRVVACFERVLGVSPVGVEDDFFELGGHSLLAVSLFAEIERLPGGRRLPLATIFEAPTPRRLAARLAPGAPAARWDNLVPLKPEGTRPPLFAVAAGDGNVVGFGPLARRLSADQPLYVLQPSGLDGRHPLDEGIDAMAERYLAALRRVQGHGPYLLAGRCNGATVAYEIAQRLTEDGEEVALLASIDSAPPPAGPAALAPGIPYDPMMESAWLRARRAGEGTPDPEQADGPARLAAWLGSPAGPGVTHYLYEAWHWRDDLIRVWPDPLGADAGAVAEWGWDHAPREHGLVRALLEPVPARAEPMGERLRRARARSARAARELRTGTRWTAMDLLERRLGRQLPEARERLDRRVLAAAGRARRRYRAKPWQGRVLLITSPEFEDKPTYAAWKLRARGGVDRRRLPFGHVEMLREPGAASLARCLETRIDEVLTP